MAERTPEPGVGNVEITLAGKTQQLVPSLAACMALSRAAGGINMAVERCRRLDFDAMVEVVAQGLNVNPSQKARLVEPAVYETGLINIADSCILFLHVVANGGSIPPDNPSGRALDALVQLIGYAAGEESLLAHLEALSGLRADLEAIYLRENGEAEAEELDDPLAGNASLSGSSTDA